MSTPAEGLSPIVWLNDHFLPLDKAHISPLDRGFLYGDGVFETMRAEDGKVLFLDEHLQRLFESLEALRIRTGRGDKWPQRIVELLDRNHLVEGSAAVKILVSRGMAPQLGLPETAAPTVLFHARKYVPPDSIAYSKGWRLHIVREGFAPPLARHKSLNYLYYLAARQEAVDGGCDEAIILDPEGLVAETAAGALIGCTRGQWWTPKTSWRLRSVTLTAVTRILNRQGLEIEEKRIEKIDLLSAETVWVLNSLMLVMPAAEADGTPFPSPEFQMALQLRDILIQSAAPYLSYI